jgi:hypothetical protein
MIQILKRETMRILWHHFKIRDIEKIKDQISIIILKKKARSSKACLDYNRPPLSEVAKTLTRTKLNANHWDF